LGAPEPVSLLVDLIGHDTHNPAGNEPALAARLRDELAARKPDDVRLVEVPRPAGDGRAGNGAYVLATWGTPRLVINSHLDTVPANAGWTGDPWKARVQNGHVIGLGAADTKGAIAAILCALDDCAPDGGPRDLAILFSGDEELGGTVMRALMADRASGPLAHVTQAIVCEPTSCRAGTRHRGVCAIVAGYAGAGGHSSNADRMPAPIADLARVAVVWDDWGRARREIGPPGFHGMCMNVAKLDGGVAFNVVPDRAELSMSFRPPPGQELEPLLDELECAAHALSPAVACKRVLANPSFETRDLDGFRPWLGSACDAPTDLAFWTEAAVLSHAGIDAVVFGPGSIAQAHAPDEYVPIADLAAARETFARMFRVSRSVDHGAR
jgi:acetylornithine deacetylase